MALWYPTVGFVDTTEIIKFQLTNITHTIQQRTKNISFFLPLAEQGAIIGRKMTGWITERMLSN